MTRNSVWGVITLRSSGLFDAMLPRVFSTNNPAKTQVATLTANDSAVETITPARDRMTHIEAARITAAERLLKRNLVVVRRSARPKLLGQGEDPQPGATGNQLHKLKRWKLRRQHIELSFFAVPHCDRVVKSALEGV